MKLTFPLSLYFEGITDPEAIKVTFQSKDKVFLASSKTQFQLQDVSHKFYDSRDEKARCSLYDDDRWLAYVIYQFAGRGYKFIKIENGIQSG